MPVIYHLRNVINPWQTEKDIRVQTKSAYQILAKVPKEKIDEWLGFHLPDKIWEVYPEK